MSFLHIPSRSSRQVALITALAVTVGGLGMPATLEAQTQGTPNGTTELSPAPVNQTKAVPPNVVVTFDDSGSMAWDYMGDNRPFDNEGWGSDRWVCAGVINPNASSGIGAHVMNGVYYNPNVDYVPPVNADGTSFPNADPTLEDVWDDGVTANRPLNPNGARYTTDFSGTKSRYRDARWTCPADVSGWYDSGSSPIDDGGPYYYQLKESALDELKGQLDQYGNPTRSGLRTLYDEDNWEAVAVPESQYQNWANWWAYYHTRNLMARSSLSRVFGAPALAAKTADGGFGSDIRVAWQNINDDDFDLPGRAIISALIDTSECRDGDDADPESTQQSGATKTAPSCYRSAFFNWIFQVGKSGGTPNRSALARAGEFFTRGESGTTAHDTLQDPYWQPPQRRGTNDSGSELFCRQNFSIQLTDGLWNGGSDGPRYRNLTLPDDGDALPDGVKPPVPADANVTAIYAPVHDKGNYGYASLSDIAYNYWATNLRPDLYDPGNDEFVPPYLPDTYTGLFGGAGKVNGGNGKAKDIPAEQYFNPKNDPATWPHMASYMIGLGVSGRLNFSENTDCKVASGADLDACDLRKGIANSSGDIGWPTPDGDGNGITANIDDTWHAALAGRGQFFSASNPQQLVDQLTSVLSNIAARASTPTTSAVNASVATTGSLSFNTGHRADWSGLFQAVTLKNDGTIGNVVWDAGDKLDGMSATSRKIFTDTYSIADCTKTSEAGSFSGGVAFSANASLDCVETMGIETPALSSGTDTADTLANRIAYLRGDQAHESDGTYRKRAHFLGAIIRSQPVYVSYPGSGYYDNWPGNSPEANAVANGNSYSKFVTEHADRAGTVYVGANDGMLHAFAAPAPECTTTGTGTTCTYGNGGTERWAFVPRAVYGNLGNLTSVTDFNYRPTVDGTPVTRDVFFTGDSQWHTMLAGGVGLGGRGVYALDVTDPTGFGADDVLWEFDSDMTTSSGCVAISGTQDDTIGCRSTDLGYTASQVNIGRLANGKWVVLIPNGYFPDCSKPDIPTADKTRCQAIADQAPKYADGSSYSALFVLDAETGEIIAELKTPNMSTDGVHSFGLGPVVLGDYNNDQIDDVAYAGDLEGNMWRFDLSAPDPSDWKVTLAYEGEADADGRQGVQPITSMPHLFPDPATNRFMVVFGTGKYLGAGDNTTAIPVQSVYGIRDQIDKNGDPITVTHDDLLEQDLTETNGTDDLAGTTLRKLTDNPIASTNGGWYFDLRTTTTDGGTTVSNPGERVIVTPAAIFSTNTVVISTLIPSSNNYCNPSVTGAIMFVNATDGGPGGGVSMLGGYPYVGARVSNVRTSGTLPMVSRMGGGKVYFPGTSLKGRGSGGGGSGGGSDDGDSDDGPLAGDSPIWRRRSWSILDMQK